MFDIDRFNVDIGDTKGGDVDRGELGMGGDTLLLLEIDGLEDQNLETFSLVQAGILEFSSFLFPSSQQNLSKGSSMDRDQTEPVW